MAAAAESIKKFEKRQERGKPLIYNKKAIIFTNILFAR